MFKANMETPERRHGRRSGVFIVNFEHISQLVLMFLLLTLNMKLPAGCIHPRAQWKDNFSIAIRKTPGLRDQWGINGVINFYEP